MSRASFPEQMGYAGGGDVDPEDFLAKADTLTTAQRTRDGYTTPADSVYSVTARSPSMNTARRQAQAMMFQALAQGEAGLLPGQEGVFQVNLRHPGLAQLIGDVRKAEDNPSFYEYEQYYSPDMRRQLMAKMFGTEGRAAGGLIDGYASGGIYTMPHLAQMAGGGIYTIPMAGGGMYVPGYGLGGFFRGLSKVASVASMIPGPHQAFTVPIAAGSGAIGGAMDGGGLGGGLKGGIQGFVGAKTGQSLGGMLGGGDEGPEGGAAQSESVNTGPDYPRRVMPSYATDRLGVDELGSEAQGYAEVEGFAKGGGLGALTARINVAGDLLSDISKGSGAKPLSTLDKILNVASHPAMLSLGYPLLGEILGDAGGNSLGRMGPARSTTGEPIRRVMPSYATSGEAQGYAEIPSRREGGMLGVPEDGRMPTLLPRTAARRSPEPMRAARHPLATRQAYTRPPIVTRETLGPPTITREAPRAPVVTREAPRAPVITREAPRFPVITREAPRLPVTTEDIVAISRGERPATTQERREGRSERSTRVRPRDDGGDLTGASERTTENETPEATEVSYEEGRYRFGDRQTEEQERMAERFAPQDEFGDVDESDRMETIRAVVSGNPSADIVSIDGTMIEPDNPLDPTPTSVVAYQNPELLERRHEELMANPVTYQRPTISTVAPPPREFTPSSSEITDIPDWYRAGLMSEKDLEVGEPGSFQGQDPFSVFDDMPPEELRGRADGGMTPEDIPFEGFIEPFEDGTVESSGAVDDRVAVMKPEVSEVSPESMDMLSALKQALRNPDSAVSREMIALAKNIFGEKFIMDLAEELGTSEGDIALEGQDDMDRLVEMEFRQNLAEGGPVRVGAAIAPNEYVLTARQVRNIGGGSVDEGASRLKRFARDVDIAGAKEDGPLNIEIA